MKIITVLSQKGGSGKTTVATNLAVAAHQAGLHAVLLDLDPQASATQWYKVREEMIDKLPPVVPTHPAALPGVLDSARAQGVDLVFLDTAPHANSEAFNAAEAADVVLVPSKATITDLRALGNTLRVCKGAGVTPHIVLTMIEPSARFLEEARATLQKLAAAHAFVTLPLGIGNRVAFHYAQIDGRSVLEFEPDGKAAAEIRALFEHASMLAFKNSSRTDHEQTAAA